MTDKMIAVPSAQLERWKAWVNTLAAGLPKEDRIRRGIELKQEIAEALLREAAQPEKPEPIELLGIPETIKESSGWWQSCSGCHESNEGMPTGPFSKALNCHLGGGCSECGGIGAIWDNGEGYDVLANMLADSADEELRRDAELLDWLMRKISGRDLRRIGVLTSGNCDRDAIRAAIAAEKREG